MSRMVCVVAALFMTIAILVTVAAPRALAYPGESALEKLETATFDFEFATEQKDAMPAAWRHPRVREYITSPYRKTADVFVLPGPKPYGSPGCWPASGKAVCGEYDPKHHLLAFFHSGCCASNALMYYPNKPPFEVPTDDLSALRTTTGLRIGSNAAEIVQNLGKPSIFHEAGGSRLMYAYFYPTHRSCGYWIVFTLRANRVIGIEDTHGC